MTLLAEAYTAYLGPLLKKHEEGKFIIWEDLEASYAAMKDVMKSSDNIFVLKRVEDLHKSQVQAYKEAATKALREWAQTSVPLQPMEENDTEAKFVDRCVSALGSSKRPNWKIDSASMIVTIQIRKRAKTIFAKYNTHHHEKPNSNDNEEEEGEEGEEESGEEDGDDDDEEEGEMGEDGEVEDNDTAAAATAAKTSTNKSSSVKTTKPIKAAAGKQKKVPPPGKGKGVPRKKGTTAKAGNPASRASGRKGGPANRGRRNARGGKSNNNN